MANVKTNFPTAPARSDLDLWLALKLVAEKSAARCRFLFPDQRADAIADATVFLVEAAAKFQPGRSGRGGAEAYFSRVADRFMWKWQRKNSRATAACRSGSGKLEAGKRPDGVLPLGCYDRAKKQITHPASRKLLQQRLGDMIARCRKHIDSAGHERDVAAATLGLRILEQLRKLLLGPKRPNGTCLLAAFLAATVVFATVAAGCHDQDSQAARSENPPVATGPQTSPVTPEPNSLLLFVGGLGAAIMIWPRRWRKLR